MYLHCTCFQTVSHKSKQTALENGNGGMNSCNSSREEGEVSKFELPNFSIWGKKDVFLYLGGENGKKCFWKRIIFGNSAGWHDSFFLYWRRKKDLFLIFCPQNRVAHLDHKRKIKIFLPPLFLIRDRGRKRKKLIADPRCWRGEKKKS